MLAPSCWPRTTGDVVGRRGASRREASSNGSKEAKRHTPLTSRPAAISTLNTAMTQCGGTIEDQIRQVDRIVKDCEGSRKCMEILARRLDDLNDEVKRYRDFLSHEKSRRDPALYKTNNVDRPSVYNDNICGTMSNLTSQLTLEWSEKLKKIHTGLQTPPPTSTPGSRNSDRN